MIRFPRWIATLSVTIIVGCATAPGPSREVTFQTDDGVTLYADVHPVRRRSAAPVVMLFHQGGGDARGEYGPIIPPLLERGYNVVAVDLRGGGSRFGKNRTLAELPGRQYAYCDTYGDLTATLRYVRRSGFRGPLIVWGSSYSATLAFRLAAEHAADVAAVLAFSPASGPPMAPCPIDAYLPRVVAPVLVLRPVSEMQLENVQEQDAVLEKHRIPIHVAVNGVHGSSMLVAERVKGDVAPTWNRVLNFLERVTVRPRSLSPAFPVKPDVFINRFQGSEGITFNGGGRIVARTGEGGVDGLAADEIGRVYSSEKESSIGSRSARRRRVRFVGVDSIRLHDR